MFETRPAIRLFPSLRLFVPHLSPQGRRLLTHAYTAGDLLRAEQVREGSQFGGLIQTCIREGTIVPMEITVKLLENAMKAEIEKRDGTEGWLNGRGRFLIDGFPRKMDQALKFEEDVCHSTPC